MPGETPLGARTRTNNKLNPHMTPSPGIELGPSWWEIDREIDSLLKLKLQPEAELY